MSPMIMDLTGKVALVTGGSRGIGKVIALAMAEKGAEVAICGRKQDNLDKAADEFQRQGFQVMARTAHVGKAEQVASLFEAIRDRFGRLDILVNNVGMNILTPSVSEVEEGLWDKIIETNLKGPFLVSREAVKLMKERGRGKIINISSTAARKAARGMGVYGIAKAGLEMLTKVLAVELARDHIAVNAVAPSMVKTAFSQPLWGDKAILDDVKRLIPMGRIAEPEEVAGIVLFLASDLSTFITGEVIIVDGGSMA